MLITYSVISSMIPEKLSDIKVIARKILNQHACGDIPWIPQDVLLCLERVEAEESIYISVCGSFHLSKSFILSAIGTILTYDLLIINAFLDDKKKR